MFTNDLRLWKPDETCEPFLISSTGTYNNLIVASWRTPDNLAAVIAMIRARGTFKEKAVGRIIILEGNVSIIDATLPCIPLHGALKNVEEISSSGAIRQGIAVSTDDTGFPCRIRLKSGQQYSVYYVDTDALNNSIVFEIYGWTFPNVPR